MLKFLTVTLFFTLAACGGGGSSSGSPPTPPPTGGGGGSGSGTVTAGGLLSGGAGVLIDTGLSGFQLDVAVGGTGLSAGRATAGDVQDFSSIIANGVTLDTNGADFQIEGQTGTQDDLRQGQQVLVLTDSSDVALRVDYRANVKGPVTQFTLLDPMLGRASLSVLGQAVTTDATTTFDGIDVGNIAVGDLLELSGTLDDVNVLQASYVELKTSLSEYKAIGVAQNVAATTFTLNGLTVDYANAALQDFDNMTISNGDVVEVRGLPASFTTPDQFAVTDVERLPRLRIGETAFARVEGFIDSFIDGTEFTVQTTPVTTNASTLFRNGDASHLGLGVKVQIEGSANGSGVVVANQLTIQPTQSVRLEGNVENVGSGTVQVLGVTMVIRPQTQLEDDSSTGADPLTLADLSIGDEVEVRGYVDADVIAATRLEREDDEDRARLRGPVTAVDAAAQTLSIAGVSLATDAVSTEFEDENDNPLSAAAFFAGLSVGDFVQARWDVFTATSVVVDSLEYEDD